MSAKNATTASAKSNSEYMELLAKIQDFPTLPIVATQVSTLINDPTSSAGDIAAVMKKDQVITAKVLRLVNSSYYGVPGKVADVQRALAFLGFNTVAQLVLGLSVYSLFNEKSSEHFPLTAFWKHALATAVTAEMLAKRLKLFKLKPEEAFTCGLLHDIGKLVLNEIDPLRLETLCKSAAERKSSFIDVEREFDLPTHPFLGEVIAKKWGLPQSIQLAIRYHHQDVSKMDSILPSVKPLIQLVRLANTLVVHAKIGQSGNHSEPEITTDLLSPLGLKESDVTGLIKDLYKEMERAGDFINAYR